MDEPDDNSQAEPEQPVPMDMEVAPRNLTPPPPLQEEERPREEAQTSQEARMRGNDSFDATVAIVPRSQKLARNDLRPTRYNRLAHIVTTPVQKIHEYVYKYINLIGQVVSVFRTIKGNIVIRLFDGTAHRFFHHTHLFLAEEAMIDFYYSEPMMQFHNIPKDYCVDILVYGEFIPTAESLRSGDMIHIINIHMFRSKTQRQIAPSVHENGQLFNRQIALLDDEDPIIVDKKGLLVEKLEYIKANPRNNTSRMAGFFNRPSAQVDPLQQQVPCSSKSADGGHVPTGFQTAGQILAVRAASMPRESQGGGKQKRPAEEEDDVEPFQQPPKKSSKVIPSPQKEAPPPVPTIDPPSVPDPPVPTIAPPSTSCRAISASTTISPSRKTNRVAEPPIAPEEPKKIPDPPTALSGLDVKAFFRNRIQPLPETDDVVIVPMLAATIVGPNKSIFDILKPKPVLLSTSVQTSPVKNASKAVQVNIEPVKPTTRDSSTQRTPVKTKNTGCDTDSVKTRAAQISSIKSPPGTSAAESLAAPNRIVYIQIKKETTTSPKSLSPPRPPPRSDSLTRGIAIPTNKNSAPTHEKSKSPGKSREQKPVLDPIELKPRLYEQPQQNIFAKPKYPTRRQEADKKGSNQSVPFAYRLKLPRCTDDFSSVSNRTRSATKMPRDPRLDRTFSSESDQEEDMKPVRPVINKSFLELEKEPKNLSQEPNTRRSRGTSRRKKSGLIKSER